jgi:hypothetical protein
MQAFYIYGTVQRESQSTSNKAKRISYRLKKQPSLIVRSFHVKLFCITQKSSKSVVRQSLPKEDSIFDQAS